jgi:hypothetical protein
MDAVLIKSRLFFMEKYFKWIILDLFWLKYIKFAFS